VNVMCGLPMWWKKGIRRARDPVQAQIPEL
jgi:hypothetical protein